MAQDNPASYYHKQRHKRNQSKCELKKTVKMWQHTFLEKYIFFYITLMQSRTLGLDYHNTEHKQIQMYYIIEGVKIIYPKLYNLL